MTPRTSPGFKFKFFLDHDQLASSKKWKKRFFEDCHGRKTFSGRNIFIFRFMPAPGLVQKKLYLRPGLVCGVVKQITCMDQLVRSWSIQVNYLTYCIKISLQQSQLYSGWGVNLMYAFLLGTSMVLYPLGKIFSASSVFTLGWIMHSFPNCQSTGVATLCLTVNWRESIALKISLKILKLF